MIGIGIDTGGTYTDAVLFDTETHRVLSQAKAPTTRGDLRVGIMQALQSLEPTQVRRASYLALSTTLATNACVEGKGGNAKLVLIGVKPTLIEKMQGVYGLPPAGEICFLPGDPLDPEEEEPDWEAFARDAAQNFAGYDSAAIVQMNPKYNDGAYELTASRILQEQLGLPCVRGYALYQELNVQKRAATALLNARLMPVMESFFRAMDASMEAMGLQLPMVIVRSDGSVMSRAFAMDRPVETLLCGPAASIIGAKGLSDCPDALIVDMGGTTTDVAMIRGGKAVPVGGGITVGQWRTMVQGVSIDTFALGGDTVVRYRGKALQLGERRVIPLSMLADRYPEVVRRLRTLVHMDQVFHYPACEFFLLVRRPAQLSAYTPSEQRFIRGLENGPLIYREAAQAAGISPHVLSMKRLEDTGIVMRAGVTPTDVMHVRGDYQAFHTEAARLGVAYLATVTGTTAEEVCTEIYDLVKERLYDRLTPILLQYEIGRPLAEAETVQLEKMTRYLFAKRRHGGDRTPQDAADRNGTADAVLDTATDAATDAAASDPDSGEAAPGNGSAGRSLGVHFSTPVKLIGIGGPIHLFLPEVAALLGTEAVFPPDGKVANAIGAAMGNINAQCVIRIEPYKGIRSSYLTYVISGGAKTVSMPEYRDALAEGQRLAEAGARERARQQGAKGEPRVTVTVREKTYRRTKYSREELVETIITANAEEQRE